MKKETVEKANLLVECCRLSEDPESDVRVAVHECTLPGTGKVAVMSVIHRDGDTVNVHPVAIILDNGSCGELRDVDRLGNLKIVSGYEKEEEEDTVEGS